MNLRSLFPGLANCPAQLDVVDITSHSKEVVPGGLFLAFAGTRRHGLGFLADAVAHGARVVAWEPGEGVAEPALPENVTGLPVPGLKARTGSIANEFFARPSAALDVIGITGTNGKTTVAWLLVQALEKLQCRAGYMGTLGHGLGTRVTADALTTPDCISVHRRLRKFVNQGASHVAMEVSSHALQQGRVDGVSFRVAAFTNLTRDHLDYHGDMAGYGKAKARLFMDHGPAAAVINIGDGFGHELAGTLARKQAGGPHLVRVAAGPEARPADIRVHRLEDTPDGQRLQLANGGRRVEFVTPLLGAFNVENLAMAAGVLMAEGFGLDAIGASLAACGPPPGRMELIPAPDGPRVIVDFAHTPDALQRVLEALRALGPAQLWCVFGCGGERDAGKRAAMGSTASLLADRVIITDDNPRGEDPGKIAADIRGGMRGGAEAEIIHDRAAAISHAIRLAGRNDIVLVAGKGHESVQLAGGGSRPFSDQVAVRQALAGRA